MDDEILLSGVDKRLQPLPETSLLKDGHCQMILTPLQALYRTGNSSQIMFKSLLAPLHSRKVKTKAFGFSGTATFPQVKGRIS